ncbi:MAG: hypothetical protein Fur0025_22140 [Oscillatoriaceae cyanobacterium]
MVSRGEAFAHKSCDLTEKFLVGWAGYCPPYNLTDHPTIYPPKYPTTTLSQKMLKFIKGSSKYSGGKPDAD